MQTIVFRRLRLAPTSLFSASDAPYLIPAL